MGERELEMQRILRGCLYLGLALGVSVGAMPVQASEVVKLARLVVSGKRSAAESPRGAPPEARTSTTSPQVHGSGGNDEAGTAPAPARGVS